MRVHTSDVDWIQSSFILKVHDAPILNDAYQQLHLIDLDRLFWLI